MEWRCAELYTLAMIDAGIGCVLRALCSGTACSPARLGLWRDESLFLSGGLGLSMTFSQLQCALNRLRESPDTVDAPAGAIVLRKMGNLTSGWSVLALGVGVYIFGAWLRTLSGKHHSHAVCYNAEARVLYLAGDGHARRPGQRFGRHRHVRGVDRARAWRLLPRAHRRAAALHAHLTPGRRPAALFSAPSRGCV